jgi:hypothetical protein
MENWKPINTAPKSRIEPFLVLENKGLFSGGWTWQKAISVHGKYFNTETKKEIIDPQYWYDIDKNIWRP